MTRFFRNIRQKLAAQNKVAAYSRYAIGEILLVVIGILIALQINNWNDQRIKKIEVANIYKSILEELNTDILLLDEYLPVFNWKNEILNRIVHEDISLEEWINNVV